ncbi:YrdB family protein [Microbacterium paludicola]|jgi:hypothetical protein|uniref:YrdB family protein n=1 Tax=Microbacterium paludicola TaxID=300019 RepID=UPI0031D230A4
MPDTATRRISALDVLRFLTELVAVGSLALWGFLAWSLPWNIVAGLGAPALAILLWALFVSPKAVFAVHPFIRIVVELLIFLSATLAWWALGQPWIGLAVGVVSVAVGVAVARRNVA